MTLWVVCEEHGVATPHDVVLFDAIRHCPGGRPATPTDLVEALGGEKVDWCLEHRMPKAAVMLGEVICREVSSYRPPDSKTCRMVERILTPALDQEKQ